MLERIAELRGTPPRGDIGMYLVSRQAAVEFFGGGSSPPDAAPPPEPRQRDLRQDVYRLLGLVPDRSDVAQQDAGYLGSLITGFYEPTLDAFYLVDDLGGPAAPQARATVVHELVHALQDQYYDLQALERRVRGDWEMMRVLASVLEGDALWVEAFFFGRPLRQIPPCFTLPVARPGTPYAVQRDLDSWYFDGYCFIKEVVERQPGGIDAVFRDLPTTTEQLLHPDKYLAREPDLPVSLTPLLPALGDAWQELGGNKLGEYLLQNILHLGLDDRARVQAAAAGWGGDAWRLYGGPEDALLFHAAIAWDSAEEAEEFWQAFAASLSARVEGRMETPLGWSRASLEGKVWLARLHGGLVSLIVASDAAAAELVADYLSR